MKQRVSHPVMQSHLPPIEVLVRGSGEELFRLVACFGLQYLGCIWCTIQAPSSLSTAI